VRQCKANRQPRRQAGGTAGRQRAGRRAGSGPAGRSRTAQDARRQRPDDRPGLDRRPSQGRPQAVPRASQAGPRIARGSAGRRRPQATKQDSARPRPASPAAGRQRPEAGRETVSGSSRGSTGCRIQWNPRRPEGRSVRRAVRPCRQRPSGRPRGRPEEAPRSRERGHGGKPTLDHSGSPQANLHPTFRGSRTYELPPTLDTPDAGMTYRESLEESLEPPEANLRWTCKGG
jgi:hypothetical protein